MGRPDFRQSVAYPAPPVVHALHDDDVDVVDGDLAEAIDDGLPVEPVVELEPKPSGVLLYRDQLDAKTLD